MGSNALWRWLPPVVSLVWLSLVPGLHVADAVAREELIQHRSATLVFSILWAMVAVVLALIPWHGNVSRNLRGLSPRTAIIWTSIVLALGLLAWQEYASWSWIPLLLLLFNLSLAGGKPGFVLASLLIAVLLPAASLEAGLYWLRHSPSTASHASVYNLAKRLYYLDRDLVQYDRECAQYDPELFYTLRPGHCVFQNTEFYTELSVNHLGVRDDEESLVAPQVIVIGDSTSMGWGAMDQEAYPNILEETTGLRVLNAGVSSYATEREMKMLARMDRSHLRWLLLQYCPNDAGENDYYVHANFSPEPRTEEYYDGLVRKYEIERRYYPGRYTTFLINESLFNLGRSLGFEWPPAEKLEFFNNFELEVENLLDVVENTPLDLSGVDIIVYELPEREFRRTGFADLVAKALEGRKGRRNMDRIHPVDVLRDLVDSDFGVLDGHINGHGHRKVARTLAGVLTGSGSVATQ